MMSRLISLGSVTCNSTWIPSSSLLNLSFELAYTIFILTLEVSGDLKQIHKYEKERRDVSGGEGGIDH